MDSSSFELTLKPCKIYVPKIWSTFLNDLSKIHDLHKRLVVVRNLKLDLEQEAVRLAASILESFTMSMAFLKNAIKALEEEEEVIMKDMKKPHTPIIYVNMSKDGEDKEEGTPRGRHSANGSHQKQKGDGILALEEGCRGEGNSSANSLLLYLLSLQKTQLAQYQHEGCLVSGSNVPSFPPLASRDEDTLPVDPYIQYTQRQSRRAEPTSGANSFDPQLRKITEVRSNLHKRKRASEELSQAPSLCPSIGAMPTTLPSLPLALSSLSSPDGHVNGVPSFSGSSDTVFTKPVQVVSDGHVIGVPSFSGSSDTVFMKPVQVVSDNRKRVLENPRQPSSETMLTGPVPRVVLDKGKRVVVNPSPRLLFRSSKAKSSRSANHSRHVVAPVPAPAPSVASYQAQPNPKGWLPPYQFNQISRSRNL